MKTNSALAQLAALSLLATSSYASANEHAQNHAHSEGFHLGLGTGIGTSVNLAGNAGQAFAGTDATQAMLLLPMDIQGVVRVEPYFNMASFSFDVDRNGQESNIGGSSLGFGVGVSYIHDIAPSTLIGFGARLGPRFVGSSQTDTANGVTVSQSNARTDFLLQPTCLGEYFFSKHFSLGAELGIGINFVGNTTNDPEPTPPNVDEEESGTLITTTGSFFVRWFFL
jgi:hypothetical protein